jgi:prepilin peptidase CpaA
MVGELFALGVLPVLITLAAGWDVASFTIPNFIPAAMVGAFAAYALGGGMPINLVGVHLLVGFLGLAIGFALFALGYIGGGDAKFFAAVLVWLGNFHDVIDYALVASLLGGGLSIVLLTLRRAPLPVVLANQAWIARLHDSKSGVPYGLALGAGALVVLPYTEIFRAAAAV